MPFHCRCGIQTWVEIGGRQGCTLKDKVVWSAPSICFVYVPELWALASGAKEFGMEDLLFFFWNFWGRRLDFFSEPSGTRMGKPVWATGISSKRRSTAGAHRPHHGSKEPVFVITNATGKKCLLFTAWQVFLFFWSCDSPTGSRPCVSSGPACPHRFMTTFCCPQRTAELLYEGCGEFISYLIRSH